MDTSLLNRICLEWHLGTLACPPWPLTGGFMHKMYSLFTDKGKYAVKLPNPYVMKRDTAQENYHVAEELEARLEERNLPILPALVFNGNKMQEIDGQFFYLYDWYDGKALKDGEINEAHCSRIGELLAVIHGIDRREAAPKEEKELRIDWDFYIHKLAACNEELHKLVLQNRELLYESQEKGNLARKKLPAVEAICHNDMDSKNVLWKGEDCRIIDLECLAYSNPFLELYELALCWSGYESCSIDYNLFMKLIQAYARAGGELPKDWEVVYDSNCGRLEWLEYSLKRALGMDCAPEEIAVGVSEARETIAHAVYYRNAKERILHYLNQQ
ncbi:MAG: phosphotransferase [Lachnospiraceae bacterium]|nr:phosphotransferase [Lachnospiraceae bacterium]